MNLNKINYQICIIIWYETLSKSQLKYYFTTRVEKSSGSLMSDLAQIWRRLDRLVLTVYFGPDLRLVRNRYYKKCKKWRTCKEGREKEHNITSLLQELGYIYM